MARMGSFSFDGMRDLQRQLNQMQQHGFEEFMEGCAKELAARLLRKLIKNTPVGIYDKPVDFFTKDGKHVSFVPQTGKNGGTLRRGWATQRSQGFDVRHENGMYVIELVNPTYYASYFEFGHRTANHKGWVRGHFVMTTAEHEIEGTAPRVLEKRIRDFLKECFGDGQ